MPKGKGYGLNAPIGGGRKNNTPVRGNSPKRNASPNAPRGTKNGTKY